MTFRRRTWAAWILSVVLVGGACMVSSVSLVSAQTASAAAVSKPVLVSMGDSFSSGEANPPFDDGTNVYERGTRTRVDLCHRSGTSFPRLLGASRSTQIACSGAKIENILDHGMITGWSGSPPDDLTQIEQLRRIVRTQTVGAVTITVGGNDLGFDSQISDCFNPLKGDCLSDLNEMSRKIDRVTTRLRDFVYPAIRREVGSSVPIVVVGYPRLFPTNERAPVNCSWLTSIEQQRANQVQSRFDTATASAVRDTRDSNIKYVSVLGTSRGHELCTNDSWFYPVQISCKFGGDPVKEKSFCAHPLANVQSAISNSVGSALPDAMAPQLRGVQSISTGESHTCALDITGLVRCWGSNNFGELGDGADVDHSATPTLVRGVVGARAITSGVFHSCVLNSVGEVKCWGDNSAGQLGPRGPINGSSATAIQIPGIVGATSISAGGSFTCVIVTGGVVNCWGTGALGGGGRRVGSAYLQQSYSAEPVTIPGIRGASAVSVAGGHACAIVIGGVVKCWGGNVTGDLGNGSTLATPDASVVANVTGATELVVADRINCVRILDGSVRCWGQNFLYILSPSSSMETVFTSPVNISAATLYLSISIGESHACVVTTDRRVACWGLTLGGNGGYVLVPTVVGGSTRSVRSGSEFSCAVTLSSSVMCWGRNDSGQLGHGTTLDSSRPVPVVL